jgi:protocatechuate 3,4-dioxygenase beta subunit
VSGQIQEAPGEGDVRRELGHRVLDTDRPGDVDPPYLYPDYVSTRLRAPKRPLVILPHTLSELSGPAFGEGTVGELDHDLTQQHEGEPIGQRIIVSGRLLDSDGRPIRNQLLEIWQANAAGRYVHKVDQHPAPLDPNFTGAGRCLTDDDGRYRFVTIKPGSYPWQNHDNAWRPAHIHFSVFGRAFTHRLVTQMYFPDDPLFAHDPIFQSVRDPAARQRMISSFDIGLTVPSWAQGYSFDIVVGGPAATPLEH